MHGGGVAGQASAVRHGIAKALVDVDPALRGELKRRGMLTRDARVKERRKAGLKKARKTAAVLQALDPRPWPNESFSAPTGSGARSAICSHPSSRCSWAARPRSKPEADRPQVVIVRDTRESGPMLEDALAAGVASAGGDAMLAGCCRRRPHRCWPAASTSTWPPSSPPRTTPTPTTGSSSSTATGTKLDDAAEAAIESRLEDRAEAEVGTVRTLEGAFDDYLRELRSAFKLDLSGRRIALDCANGATFRVGAADLRGARGRGGRDRRSSPTGATSTTASAPPRRRHWPTESQASDAEIGFAFDGDGDRLIAVDSEGEIHDGDELIALAARHLRARASSPAGSRSR